MKKILFFALFIIGSVFSQAQTAEQVEKMKIDEFSALEKRVTFTNENLAFNKNQVAKLQRVFHDKVEDILVLRSKNVAKGDYLGEFMKIENKYIPKIEAILTTQQKIEYRRNGKKKHGKVN